jgi:hypothetical protein
VPDLTEDEVRRMLKACDGPDLRDKRDKATLIPGDRDQTALVTPT